MKLGEEVGTGCSCYLESIGISDLLDVAGGDVRGMMWRIARWGREVWWGC